MECRCTEEGVLLLNRVGVQGWQVKPGTAPGTTWHTLCHSQPGVDEAAVGTERLRRCVWWCVASRDTQANSVQEAGVEYE